MPRMQFCIHSKIALTPIYPLLKQVKKGQRECILHSGH